LHEVTTASGRRHAARSRPELEDAMNHQLEQALMHAGRANDIDELKDLARQESRRADQLLRLVSAVLAVSGPVRIHGDIADLALPGAFSVTKDGDDCIVAHQPAPNRSGTAATP
jgi:hypothetical protein